MIVHTEINQAELIRLFSQFSKEYEGSLLLDESGHGRISGAVSRNELLDCLTTALMQNDESHCRDLLVGMCQADVPFMIVDHEIAYLRDSLIKLALREGNLAGINAVVSFFDILQEHLASAFLEHYLRLIETRNHVRLSHIAGLSEKNLLLHFEKHLQWMLELTDAMVARDLKAMPEIHHEQCEFGRWLHSEGSRLIRDKSHYSMIVRLHSDMHNIVTDIQKSMQCNGHSLPLLALMKKAQNYSLELGNEIALLNNMIIMSIYNKDSLTGLLTRRNLDRVMLNQLEISRATEIPFCLLMCDLDHFKHINDMHGHLAGDRVIVHFAKQMRDLMRQSDMLFRFGGEEFLMILPSTSYNNGLKLAEMLRCKLSEADIPVGQESIRVTASFGILEVDGNKTPFIDNEIVQELIRECDRRMYIAKERGRNQVA